MDTVANAFGASRLAAALRWAAPALSGITLALAFPPLGWWPLAWIALAPWYVVLMVPALTPRARQGVRAGWTTGFFLGLSVFLVGMVWMNEIGTVPWIVLSLIQAVPFALLGALCVALLPRLPAPLRPWVFAALWTLAEGLRSWGRYAFPWFLLSATQVRAPALVQVVSLTGQWGLSFAVAAVNALLAEAWIARTQASPRRDSWRWFAGGAVLVVAGLAVGGSWALRGARNEEGPVRRAAVAQGSFSKPRGTYTDTDRAEMLRIYLDLTRQAAEQRPAFIAWPETVTPGALLRDPVLYEIVSGLARGLQTPLLVGSVDVDEENRLWNAAFLLDRNGALLGRYDKTQLVPLGEFFPLRRYLGGIYESYGATPQDFAHGTLPGVLSTGGPETNEARLGVIICYESVFPHLSAARVRRGARTLVLLTSDQTFGTTAGPYQHADLSILRAVETRRYLVRAAASGISSVVDPWGRVRESIPLSRRGVLLGDIRLRDDLTPYARWGDWFLGFCVLLVAAACAYTRTRRQRP